MWCKGTFCTAKPNYALLNFYFYPMSMACRTLSVKESDVFQFINMLFKL